MAKHPVESNGIFALVAIKPSMNALIPSTIIVMSAQSKFAKCSKHEREGSSLRGISRTSGLAYNTVVSILRAASQRTQQVHNAQVQTVEIQEVSADEMWSFVQKNRSNVSRMN
jgi:lambda repressor-like predicted transcriptional regulator